MADKVLIVEDTRSFALLLKQLIFQAHNIECDIAETKAQAIAYLDNHGDKYFAAIADLNLPDAPNGELTPFLVSHKIPTIVFTGTSDSRQREELWKIGIADYAHKSGAHSLEYVVWMINRIKHNGEQGILIVDHSAFARKMMSSLLSTQGFKIYLAESSKEALTTIKTNSHIKIAVIDCVMDEMNGFTLATKIREIHERQNFEIIGMSGQDGADLSAQFIKSGASDFLVKPFQPEEFLCRINHAADRLESFHKLQALNKTKNQLLGTAAHDIRGPIGTIKTAADYILTRHPNPERTESLLQMIQNSSSELLLLLSDLLDVSAIESGVPKINLNTSDFSELVLNRIELYQAEADAKNITLEHQINGTESFLLDQVKIKQVIDNMLTNAIKYSPKGGYILVEVSQQQNNVNISVHDSGPGIASDEQKDLFKPFSVLSTEATGGEKKTGLGLAIAKRIVEAHKGKITYRDSDKGGACFTVSLPINAH